MALQVWETLKEAIPTYTGLSPATFFTVVALVLAIYYVVSGLFGSSSDHHERPRSFEEAKPLPPPVQIGEVTEEELKLYDGSDPDKPLLMAIKGQIYDVSQSRYPFFQSIFFFFFNKVFPLRGYLVFFIIIIFIKKFLCLVNSMIDFSFWVGEIWCKGL